MIEILNITKALSDENRIRALMMLVGGELCVCQIIEMLGLAPSTVSKHMSILKQAGLVVTRKEGRWIYYRLAELKNAAAFEAVKWLDKHLKNAPVVLEDIKRLKKIKKMDPDKLLECYKVKI
jgi:ArsR family transcriptional regulator, arsenate/arsenite/antimonite-responsive transcriptional repressor